MIFDFFAEKGPPSREAIDVLLDGPGPVAAMARWQLLASAQVSDATYARSGDRQSGRGGLRRLLPALSDEARRYREEFLGEKRLGLLPAAPDLLELPQGSFFLQIDFSLKTAYLSRDDGPWAILDNPVRREKVFRMPYIAATQWKGVLRAAMRPADQMQTERIFGPPLKPEDGSLEQDGWAGRITCYPCFFAKVGLEVQNPHDEKTGAGKVPILYECVPKGEPGRLALLYVPVDRAGDDPAEVRREAGADLMALVHAIHDVFFVRGMGGKTTSGFGLVNRKLKGTCRFHEQEHEFERLEDLYEWAASLGQP